MERTAADGRWEHDPLWRRVHQSLPLLVVWARREFRVRYRQSGLGVVWSVILPLATLAIYGTVLTKVLHVGSEHYPYISFAYAGLVPWTFTSAAISVAIPSLMSSGSVVGKVYFPREIVPLATVGASLVDLAIGTLIFIVILLAQGIGLSIHLLALPLIFAVIVVWVATVAVFGSVLTVFVRDLRQGVGLMLQLLFFATPIMYPATLVKGRLRVINDLNPLAVVVAAVRRCALAQLWPDWTALGAFFGVGVVLYVAVLAYTRSVEPRIVDVL